MSAKNPKRLLTLESRGVHFWSREAFGGHRGWCHAGAMCIVNSFLEAPYSSNHVWISFWDGPGENRVPVKVEHCGCCPSCSLIFLRKGKTILHSFLSDPDSFFHRHVGKSLFVQVEYE